ncbi:MAG: electron transport complex subunit RsxC [Bacteroidales bacterium]
MKTFKLGGIHPAENKMAASQPIEEFPLPKQGIVPVSQHLGAPAKLLVKKGDQVKTGQLIGETAGFISANIHAPYTGKVKKIDNVLDASGYRRQAVIIDVADQEEWEEGIDPSADIIREITANPDEIVEKMKANGIVGLGGATFPSHVKLMVPEGKKIEYLIINGVECEPYLTNDHRLMLEKTEEMLIGIKILMKGLGVHKAIIGIENNKMDAVDQIRSMLKDFEGISVEPLKVKYPQGGEKQLIKALINREVPGGKLPLDVGCVVNNVATAYAVYEAVQKNKPLIDRIMTVTGKNLPRQANLKVRFGTQLSALVDHVGGLPEDTGKIVSGGPMTGKALASLDVPVTKGTAGILVLNQKEARFAEPRNCIRCAKCTEVCPQGLEPYLLHQFGEFERPEDAEADGILECIECGSCNYICPSNRPLLEYIRVGKANTSEMIRNRKQK